MHLLQLNQSDDSEGETGGFKRRWLQGALQQQREHWQQRGGVNHLQGDEEFTNHSASALIQQDLDQSLIHVVKPQVLTNPNLDACASARSTGQRREHGWAWAGAGQGGVGRGMATKREQRCGKRVECSADRWSGGMNALLTFCRRHGDWQRSRSHEDKAVKWK